MALRRGIATALMQYCWLVWSWRATTAFHVPRPPLVSITPTPTTYRFRTRNRSRPSDISSRDATQTRRIRKSTHLHNSFDLSEFVYGAFEDAPEMVFDKLQQSQPWSELEPSSVSSALHKIWSALRVVLAFFWTRKRLLALLTIGYIVLSRVRRQVLFAQEHASVVQTIQSWYPNDSNLEPKIIQALKKPLSETQYHSMPLFSNTHPQQQRAVVDTLVHQLKLSSLATQTDTETLELGLGSHFSLVRHQPGTFFVAESALHKMVVVSVTDCDVYDNIQPLLEERLAQLSYSDYSIVVVGYGRGGKAACELGAALRQRTNSKWSNRVEVIAFAPPPCMNATMATNVANFTTSIVVEGDAGTRLNRYSLQSLKHQLEGERLAFPERLWIPGRVIVLKERSAEVIPNGRQLPHRIDIHPNMFRWHDPNAYKERLLRALEG